MDILDFKDGSNQGDDYLYDVNGNMTQDLNKGIFDIKYNHLNLPVEINFDEYSIIPSIKYMYDATGIKLAKSVMNEGTISTLYAGGSQKLQFFSHPEGYVEPVAGTSGSVTGFDDEIGINSSSYKYVFQYKDHLGNIRLSYSDLDLDGAITPDEIIEESNYYPFGLEHKGYNLAVSPDGNALAQQWKYNGIELEESLGLNLYEMHFRQYDPSIGRFTKIDPITHHSLSTYSGLDNNPVLLADPSGAATQDIWGRDTHDKYGIYILPAHRGKKSYGADETQERATSLSLNVPKLKSKIINEFGLNITSGNKGDAIVNNFLTNLYLTVYLRAFMEIALNEGRPEDYKAPFESTTSFPSFAIRPREGKRRATGFNRDKGSINFGHSYNVKSTIPNNTSGDYGYLYYSGSNVRYNTMGSDNLLYDSFNSPLETIFSGYAHIQFSDQKDKYVGELLFRTVDLRNKFVDYFMNSVRVEMTKLIRAQK